MHKFSWNRGGWPLWSVSNSAAILLDKTMWTDGCLSLVIHDHTFWERFFADNWRTFSCKAGSFPVTWPTFSEHWRDSKLWPLFLIQRPTFEERDITLPFYWLSDTCTWVWWPSVLWHCSLGLRESIWPQKILWRGAGWMEQGADDLHIQGVPIKTDPLICFCNNFGKCTPILILFSLLQQENYGAQNLSYFSLQCFDAVGWASGRASGL